MSISNLPADSAFSLKYGIAIAVAILILISIIMFASYACLRVKLAGDLTPPSSSSNETNNNNYNIYSYFFGLDRPVIESFPKVVLGESKRLPSSISDTNTCAICLCEYCVKDSVRCMPECNHCFHADCVDEWLQKSGSCPICRSSPVSTSAGSTPLPVPNYYRFNFV
ncbi:putative RING-H2 finger protein ATL69 [Solanum pennellii]|uniref:RING-H2 finger protein ATL69 n=1 Tax=Solanum pennellii TaxID=28526 RepID=A0ABM1FVG7_SOLPN|nr:putative RING-H2 finger protein ATL69 [Solanum pennellii]